MAKLKKLWGRDEKFLENPISVRRKIAVIVAPRTVACKMVTE
jgi:hypothetical protein